MLVRDAGATFLAPIYHELTGVICTSGTVRSHIGIVSREFQIPCVMGTTFDGDEPADGAEVEVDCSGEIGRRACRLTPTPARPHERAHRATTARSATR